MQEIYNPNIVEAEVQAQWQANNSYVASEKSTKPKYFCVSMLPYPSGKLHMGHVRNYSINDVMARYQRMRGNNVLMPMGWDAFGMPAENAAIANGVSPADWTYQNINYMRQQLQALGFAFDWSKEIATCDSNYYRWNQWLFLKMLEKGIAYKKTGTVNWDPVDQTVLANEQVIDGRGWRSGALVVKREIPMYYLRITDYANALSRDLEQLNWPDRVKLMQRNWISESHGVIVSFPYQIAEQPDHLRVFTTRADTLMGVTFVAIAPEHPLASYLAKKQSELAKFVETCETGSVAEADLATAEKKGMATGFYVSHPLTQKPIPVWIANYVLMNYGEGAVMGVPAHDERDYAFAKKYNLPIQPVISIPNETYSKEAWQNWYGEVNNGILINSGPYSGLSSAVAIEKITQDLLSMDLGKKQTSYRLRDWGISRQRYWGTPIPIIHCDHCGDVPVPEKDLPVLLPTHLVPDGTGNPLARCEEFIHTQCPQCGQPARRETDTMDTFVDSSWYYMRYTCPEADTMVDARTNYWMPMDYYIGGIEHAVLHLLYTRFWTKVMQDMSLITVDEPAKNLLTQGMVLNETFYHISENGKKTWFNPEDIVISSDEKGRPIKAHTKDNNLEVIIGAVEKMSKSKNNGIDPQAIISNYGADTARLFITFAAPPEQQLEWSGAGVDGANRFLRRLWSFSYNNHQALRETIKTFIADTSHNELRIPKLNYSEADKVLRRDIHTLLKQADFDYQRLHYNTIVSAAMKMLNLLEKTIYVSQLTDENSTHCVKIIVLAEALSILLRVLYPIVPHITFQLWNTLNYDAIYGHLLDANWPLVDDDALNLDTVELVLQINGKVRGSLKMLANATREEIEAIALAHESSARYLVKRNVRKVIVVPKRLVNIVVE